MEATTAPITLADHEARIRELEKNEARAAEAARRGELATKEDIDAINHRLDTIIRWIGTSCTIAAAAAAPIILNHFFT